MIEEELRATFARHEELAPAVGPLRAAIDRIAARRRRRRMAVRATGAALAVLAVVAVPVLGRTVAPALNPGLIEHLTGTPGGSVAPDSALNFLLLGVEGQGGTFRADSVLIAHVPQDRSRVYLVSVPRDVGADIPGHRFGRLSESFELGSTRSGAAPDLAGGARLTAQTVTDLTGVTFDGTATLTFDGLRQLTDAVGGVRLCLPGEVKSLHTRRVFPAGCQQLDGSAALDLLRQRYYLPLGGHDRDRNAQRFAAALLAEVISTQSITDPVRLSKILEAAGNGLTTDTGTSSLVEMLPILAEIGKAQPVGIGWDFENAPHGPEGVSSLDPAANGALFTALRGDTMAAWVTAHPERLTITR